MANNKATYQQVHNVSINKDALAEIASNMDLSKKDLKVLLLLFTQLDGYKMPFNNERKTKDPMNFSIIDVDTIADALYMSKKSVRKCIDRIHDEGYIEKGSNKTRTLGDGWTVKMRDGKLSAHYENTIVITKDGYEILTM